MGIYITLMILMLKNSLGYIKSLEGSVLNIFRLYVGSHHQQLVKIIELHGFK